MRMKFLKKYFTGRMNRKNFFFAAVLRGISFYSCIVLIAQLPLSDAVWWNVVLLDTFFAIFWIWGVSITTRRCFDLNWGRTLTFLVAILINIPSAISILFLFILLFFKGKESVNKYGNPDNSDFFESVFGFKWYGTQ